jgi:hypothetical protein
MSDNEKATALLCVFVLIMFTVTLVALSFIP